MVTHSVKQHLLRNRPGSDAATSRDFLRERLQKAFTRANQLHGTAQYLRISLLIQGQLLKTWKLVPQNPLPRPSLADLKVCASGSPSSPVTTLADLKILPPRPRSACRPQSLYRKFPSSSKSCRPQTSYLLDLPSNRGTSLADVKICTRKKVFNSYTQCKHLVNRSTSENSAFCYFYGILSHLM